MQGRSTDRKNKIYAVLDLISDTFYTKCEVAGLFWYQWQIAVEMTGTRGMPYCAYVPIVCALNNALEDIRPRMEDVFGEPTYLQEIEGVFRCRFNMGGQLLLAPNHLKSGMMDMHAYWCWMLDPFRFQDNAPYIKIGLTSPTGAQVEPSESDQLQAMTEFFVPGDAADLMVQQQRQELVTDYQKFTLQTGVYSCASFPPRRTSPITTPEEEMAEQKKITFATVTSYVRQTMMHEGRIHWWAVPPQCYTPLGKVVAPTLMSAVSKGSQATERTIKYLKRLVLGDCSRSSLSPAKQLIMTSTGMALNEALAETLAQAQ